MQLIQGWHVTAASNVDSISEHGLLIGKQIGFGSVWGRGVYLATDEATRDMYVNTPGSKEYVALRVEAKLQRPLCVKVGRSEALTYSQEILRAMASHISGAAAEAPEWDAVMDELLAELAESEVELNDCEIVVQPGIEDLLESWNFDGLVIESPQEYWVSDGGNQLVVFNESALRIMADVQA